MKGAAVTARPYDPALKALVETEPESWPAFLRHPTGPTRVIDADIATVSGAADKVLRVDADAPYLLHIEFVAGHDAAVLPRKLVVRNALLADRHELPVRSDVLLLRPAANSPQLTGQYQEGIPGEEPYLIFRYQVVRVWELPPELLLSGGLPLLPFSLISAVTAADLPGIIKRIERRLSDRRARAQAERVWAAAYIMLGLRFSAELAAELFRGVVSVKESSTYQAILAEGVAVGEERGLARGKVAEAKRILRLQGDAAFGPPDQRTAALIEQLEDLARLEKMLARLPNAGGWQDLLGRPATGPRNRRRRPSP